MIWVKSVPFPPPMGRGYEGLAGSSLAGVGEGLCVTEWAEPLTQLRLGLASPIQVCISLSLWRGDKKCNLDRTKQPLNMDRFTQHCHGRFLDRFIMRRVRMAGVGHVL